MVSELEKRLHKIEKYAASFCGCQCDKDDCGAGDCWPCRMMRIAEMANPNDVAQPTAEVEPSCDVVEKAVDAFLKSARPNCVIEYHVNGTASIKGDFNIHEAIKVALQQKPKDVELVEALKKWIINASYETDADNECGIISVVPTSQLLNQIQLLQTLLQTKGK